MEERKIKMIGMDMYVTPDAGPIRYPIDGRKLHTTHMHTAAKADYLTQPAESYPEYRTMWVLDAALSVLRYMWQPHRIETREWSYTPDASALVTNSLIKELKRGTPFVLACLKMPPARSTRLPLETLVLEVKRDVINEDKKYTDKLKEAKSLYASNDIYFHRIEDDPDLIACDIGHLTAIAMDYPAKVPEEAAIVAWRHLMENEGVSLYADLVESLGGGSVGIEAVHCLHGRGQVWIDLTKNPLANRYTTKVALPPLLGENRALASRLLGGESL